MNTIDFSKLFDPEGEPELSSALSGEGVSIGQLAAVVTVMGRQGCERFIRNKTTEEENQLLAKNPKALGILEKVKKVLEVL